MRGETQVSNLAGLLRCEEDLHRAAGRESDIHVLAQIRQRVKLIQVEVVRPQALERTLQFRLGAFPLALRRLAGQEDLPAIRFQRRSELHLRVAVRRGDLEIIDAPFEGFRDQARGLFRLGLHHQDSAEPHHRKPLSRLAVFPLRQRSGIGGTGVGRLDAALVRGEQALGERSPCHRPG